MCSRRIGVHMWHAVIGQFHIHVNGTVPLKFFSKITRQSLSVSSFTPVSRFTSTPDKSVNKYYLGPAPLEDMARQIATASGPCGNNREYLFKLEKALYDIGHEEDYVIELANEVRKVLGIVEKGFVKKEKKLVGSSHIPLKTAHNITALKLHRPLPLSESVGVAMDS